MANLVVPPAVQEYAELELCRRSKSRLFENHYFIKDKDGLLRLMTPLRKAQKKALAVIDWCRSSGRPVRMIVGKSRKRGLSTLFEADMLDEVIKNGYDGIVIAHDKPTSEDIFRITRRFYDHLDLQKPRLYKGQTNKNELKFDGNDGHIVVETANNKMAGTGRTPQYIHASEVAKWSEGQATLVSLLQSIGDGPSTTVIFESTFYGEDALFLPMWEEAYSNSKLSFDEDFNVEFEVTDPDRWNGYIPLFISVLDDEDAFITASTEELDRLSQTLDLYEKSLLDRGCSLEFIKWRRFTIRHKCQNNVDDFKQEYPVTPEEAVKASGRPRFDIDIIDQWVMEEPRRGLLRRSESWDRRISFMADRNENLSVFRMPQENHRYSIGVDPAEGVLDVHGGSPDQSVVIVLDVDAGEQAATYCGNISEELLIEPLLLIAEWYNWAYVVIETNSTGKHVGIQVAKSYPTERLYHRVEWDNGMPRQSRDIGWRTTIGTRNILVGDLSTAISERAVRVHDRRTALECKRFVWKKAGRVEAADGYHDDQVFALGLAIQGMKHYPANLMPVNRVRQAQRSLDFMKRNKERTVSPVTGY